MRTPQHNLYAATALLLALGSLQVQAQLAGDIATSTDAAGDLYTGTVAANGVVPTYTPVVAGDDFVPIGAAGGGGGTPTTQATLQTISGYRPPPTAAIPNPAPASGTIVAPNDIPGYTAAASGAASNGNGQNNASGPRFGMMLERNFPLLISAVAALLGGVLVL
ncbi:hypothetical protein CF326_g8119 [Tilletia indica]|nr:hypothetical protein CF326_g8119 [Tilletia indica]